MEYTDKITKYQIKKNKILEKIEDLYRDKRKDNYKHIEKIVNKIFYINNILDNSDNNKYQLISENGSKIIFLIIMGIYGVGKTTLINNFKNSIESENLVKWNYKNIQSVNDDFDTNVEKLKSSEKSLLVTIEISVNLFELVIEKIKNYSVFVINLLPKNKENYKNKLINKFFYSNKNNSNEFYNGIITMLSDSESNDMLGTNQNSNPNPNPNPDIDLFIENFNNLKNNIDSENFYLSDKDFYFLNLIMDKLILFSQKKILNKHNVQINQIHI